MANEELAEYLVDLHQDIQTRVELAGMPFPESFFEIFSEHIEEAGDFAAGTPSYYGREKGVRVDGYGGDPRENNGVLTLIIQETDQSGEFAGIDKTTVDRLFKRLVGFVNKARKKEFLEEMDISDPVYGLVEMIQTRWEEISKIRLMVFTDRKLSARVDGKASEEILGKEVVHSIWDLERLYQLEVVGRGREVIEINLVEDFHTQVPILRAANESQGSESSTYLFVMPGALLARIYERWGLRLLESNVRVYLQNRTGVNKGLRTTITTEPSKFLAFNNGLTATAENIEVENEGGALYLRRLTNLQIVNGGQTTASIHDAYSKKVDLAELFCQVKLTVVSSELAQELVPKISKYANTQNKVSNADFFSNHPFHVRLEQISRQMLTPIPDGQFRATKWFYERARGQYLEMKSKSDSPKAFELEFPKSQQIDKTQLAKFRMTFAGAPHTVSKGAQNNFAKFAQMVSDDWEKDENQFSEFYFKETIAMAILFRALEKSVSAQPWYEAGGYRANIVTYTLAKMVSDLKRRRVAIDFDQIWQNQNVDDATLEVAAVIAKEVNSALIAVAAKRGKNISEWAKQEACWHEIRDLEIHYGMDLVRIFVSDDANKQAAKQSKAVQKVDTGIHAQAKVVQLGNEFWGEVNMWAQENVGLSSLELGVLKVASKPGGIPSDKQSSALLRLMDRLELEGLPVDLRLPS